MRQMAWHPGKQQTEVYEGMLRSVGTVASNADQNWGHRGDMQAQKHAIALPGMM
jgi:hypothetical protein